MFVLKRVSEHCRSALNALICTIIAVLLAIMVLQIVCRYGFNSSLIWAEEVCRYLLIWVSFLAAFAAYEKGEIAAVTFVRDLLPRKGRLMVAITCNALGLVLLTVLVVYGLRYADRIGSQPIPALGFLLEDLFGEGIRAPATFWVYLALPVGMALLAARLLVDLVHYALMISSGGDPGDFACTIRGAGSVTLYLIAFLVPLLLGVPVALSLGVASLVYIVATDNLVLLLAFPQRMIAGIDNFVLLTIPFFILAGNLMNAADLTNRIVRCAQLLVGQIRGGLAVINIIASMMFSGVSGAATAEASALGSVMIPAMRRDGYAPAYAAALTAAGALLGPLVPPSLALILYGVLTGTSIADLFLAGIVPAFVLCGLLIVYALWKARREGHPLPPVVPHEERKGAIVGAIPALLLPVIIVGGIRSGVFTPTEAAAVASLYALCVGALLYRSLSLTAIRRCLFDTATMSAGVMLIVATASMTAFVLGIENIPGTIARALLETTDSPIALLILLNFVLLVIGLFLEPLAALILAMPILSAVAPHIGVDPVQFGVMIVLNLMIGMITPPVGLVLFIVGSIARTPLEAVSKAVLPLIGICVVVLMLVAFVAPLSLFLPTLLGK